LHSDETSKTQHCERTESFCCNSVDPLSGQHWMQPSSNTHHSTSTERSV